WNLRVSALCVSAVALSVCPAVGQGAPTAILGRWDVTVNGVRDSCPSWFEVRVSGNRTLVGQFVGQFGSARPVAKIDFANGTIHFAVPPQWDRGSNDLVVDGRLDGDRLAGVMTDPGGTRLTWTAVRAPALRP